jgi:transposase
LGLELTDPGFDYSVLSEFRARLSQGQASERLLDKLLAQCQAQGLLRAGGRQRTDATHVLAAVRVLNRLELVAETLRMALNAVVVVAPEWLKRHAPAPWYQRYSRRIEYSRRPSSKSERQKKGQTIGADTEAFNVAHADQAARAQNDLFFQVSRAARHCHWLVYQSL